MDDTSKSNACPACGHSTQTKDFGIVCNNCGFNILDMDNEKESQNTNKPAGN